MNLGKGDEEGGGEAEKCRKGKEMREQEIKGRGGCFILR